MTSMGMPIAVRHILTLERKSENNPHKIMLSTDINPKRTRIFQILSPRNTVTEAMTVKYPHIRNTLS